jgi:anti-sigma B factor antagonist
MEAGMNDMHLEAVEPCGDCAVLRVAGEIDLQTAPELRERLTDLVATGVRHLIIDASGITFLDSTGLAVLVAGHDRLRAHGGSLALAGNQERIVRLLRLTGLIRLFPPYATVAEAIGADPHWLDAIADRPETSHRGAAGTSRPEPAPSAGSYSS